MKKDSFKTFFRDHDALYSVDIMDKEFKNDLKLVKVKYEKKNMKVFDSSDYSYTRQFKVYVDDSGNEIIWEECDDNNVNDFDENFENIEAETFNKFNDVYEGIICGDSKNKN